VEGKNYLGIYLNKDTATVVCLGVQGQDRKVLGCFTVSVEETEQASQQTLAGLIAQGCAERELEFSEVAVALDCAMFMQHDVHSEFDNPKQIAATIKFDTEEALATDIAEAAIAFKINSSDQTGSQLSVFTAQRKLLSDILIALQSNNIDPVSIEPDINCLSRFICENVTLSEDFRPIFCVLSRRSGYFVVPHSTAARNEGLMRTFLVSPTQNRSELLAREVPVTTTLAGIDQPINCIKVFDSAGSANYQQLGEKLGMEASSINWFQFAGIEPEDLADCDDLVEFAIAYGAALAHLEKAQSTNFRNDFMPYQGGKLRLQKAVKFASISVTVLVLAIGLYFQIQLLKINKYRSRLHEKLEKDYSAVMFGKKPPARTSPTSKLRGELSRIRNIGGPSLDEESVSSKLTLVLEAINSCAAQTDLNVGSITVTAKSITITGDTAAKQNRNTLRFFDAIKKAGLEISTQNIYAKAGRDHFSLTAVVRK
jgi:hypothetical protein